MPEPYLQGSSTGLERKPEEAKLTPPPNPRSHLGLEMLQPGAIGSGRASRTLGVGGGADGHTGGLVRGYGSWLT